VGKLDLVDDLRVPSMSCCYTMHSGFCRTGIRWLDFAAFGGDREVKSRVTRFRRGLECIYRRLLEVVWGGEEVVRSMTEVL
jgi:hypothetical protein